jgi:hypothetical protein
MKASDSANSLTELTGNSEKNMCFICLDEDILGLPLVSSKLLRNCGCTFYVHAPCWNEWMKNKTDYDCPICHRASMVKIHISPNPALPYQPEHGEINPRKRALYCFVFLAVLVGTIILVLKIAKNG